MKLGINRIPTGIVAIALAAFVWQWCVGAQAEQQANSKDGSRDSQEGSRRDQDVSLSANASCYDKASGKLAGSSKSVTAVLVSPDGRYRAYAESEAVTSQKPIAGAECQNTTKLFVSRANSDEFRAVLMLEPSAENLGNNIDLIDWSPDGKRLLFAEGVWQWASDAGGYAARIYDAESEKLSDELFVDQAFSKYVGRHCVGVFHPEGFSSNGQVVVSGGPDIEIGEDEPEKDSCVKQEGLWLIDFSVAAVSQLPENYKVERYGKVLR